MRSVLLWQYKCQFVLHVMIGPETVLSVALLHLPQVRGQLSSMAGPYISLPNTGLNVELVDSLLGDDQLVAHTLRWDWQPRNGRSYENETYHVRVKGGGEERWLEVINQVNMFCMYTPLDPA